MFFKYVEIKWHLHGSEIITIKKERSKGNVYKGEK